MFRLKQFSVDDSLCAMKVGTDGMLLGAWANVNPNPNPNPNPNEHEDENENRILDIGTGSGLVALMLAQRCKGQIDAIDIDEMAAEQAALNFAASPWPERLHAYAFSLQDWATKCQAAGITYHTIVSNPPYFRDSLKNPDEGRRTARHTDSLSYDELIKLSEELLTEDGELSLILPAEAERDILAIAASNSLYPTRITHVKGAEGKPNKRILLALSRKNGTCAEDELILTQNGARSVAYAALCRDFYL